MRNKREKKRHIFLKIFLILLILIVIAAGALLGYAYSKFELVNWDENIDKNEIEVNEGVEEAHGYQNFYLFGVDSRQNSYDGALSDVIMVVSINHDTKKARIASVYRDTYLQFTDTTYDKITHAFIQGGPSKSMSVLNKNLDLAITEYVAINFNVVIDVVDAVGGVTIDLTSEEVSYINQYINELNKVTGRKSSRITKAGTYTLDGVQATAYARIRYTAGGDWKRTERQRQVLQLAAEKVKNMKISEINNLANTVLPQISTNISRKDISKLITQCMSYEIEETTGWPYDVGDYRPPDGVWYNPPINLEKQVIKLHEFLFDREEYVVSDTVKKISDAIIKKTGLQ